MSAAPPGGTPPPAAPPARPWWVPLLGVGSLGLGGLQALGGLAMIYLAAEIGGAGARVLLGTGLAWLVPGVLLLVSGVGVVTGSRRARVLSLAAVGAGFLAIGLVAAGRGEIPPAIAEVWEHGASRGGREVRDLMKWAGSVSGNDPEAALRDPDSRNASGWAFTFECGCPVIPWSLVVLVACASPAGRGFTAGTVPSSSRSR